MDDLERIIQCKNLEIKKVRETCSELSSENVELNILNDNLQKRLEELTAKENVKIKNLQKANKLLLQELVNQKGHQVETERENYNLSEQNSKLISNDSKIKYDYQKITKELEIITKEHFDNLEKLNSVVALEKIAEEENSRLKTKISEQSCKITVAQFLIEAHEDKIKELTHLAEENPELKEEIKILKVKNEALSKTSHKIDEAQKQLLQIFSKNKDLKEELLHVKNEKETIQNENITLRKHEKKLIENLEKAQKDLKEFLEKKEDPEENNAKVKDKLHFENQALEHTLNKLNHFLKEVLQESLRLRSKINDLKSKIDS